VLDRLGNNGENPAEEDDVLEDKFEDEGNAIQEPLAERPGKLADDLSDWETDNKDDVILEKQAKLDKANKPAIHAFMPNHPLFTTHAVTCDFSRLSHIMLNFIGGSLPRSDKGDRAAYCMMMLTLFKPWNSPADLKDEISTWDQAFTEHEFSDR
jgi:hypothetical protein